MNSQQRLILASSSPRRRELLSLLLDSFKVIPADIDESRQPSETPQRYVQRMAEEKAAAVVERLSEPMSNTAVLAADTAVVLDDECLGKPCDAAEAANMLRRLSGRVHEVLSSVALMNHKGLLGSAISTTRVWFDVLPSDWIGRYVSSGEPMDKAGAYGIQGAAAAWVHRIEGSYSGVVGLPLFETAALLRKSGWIE